MLLKEIISIINEHYPFELACAWDNVGLLLGDEDRDISRVLLALDISDKTLEEAISMGAECIISHHPILFGGIKKITTSTYDGRLVLRAAEHKIALLAAHTNMDVAKDGLNAKLAQIFCFKDSEVIESEDISGRIGSVRKTSLLELCEQVKTVLKTPFVRYSGNPNQVITRVAVGSGSSSDLIPTAIQAGADVIITGDLKYHACVENTTDTFSIIDAGHYPTEYIAIEMFASIFEDTDLTIIKSKQRDIFQFI